MWLLEVILFLPFFHYHSASILFFAILNNIHSYGFYSLWFKLYCLKKRNFFKIASFVIQLKQRRNLSAFLLISFLTLNLIIIHHSLKSYICPMLFNIKFLTCFHNKNIAYLIRIDRGRNSLKAFPKTTKIVSIYSAKSSYSSK